MQLSNVLRQSIEHDNCLVGRTTADRQCRSELCVCRSRYLHHPRLLPLSVVFRNFTCDQLVVYSLFFLSRNLAWKCKWKKHKMTVKTFKN
jgi:hypothetical protein